MDTTPSGVHVAVVSYMPGHAHSDAHWPPSGPVTREETIDTLPMGSDVSVLEVPVRHPSRLHFQSGARWVVLEIAAADHVARDGVVEFHRGTVVFNGPAPEGRRYLLGRGLPAPSALPPPVCAPDWTGGAVGDEAIILGGWNVEIRAGRQGMAYAVCGGVRAGDESLAAAQFGEAWVGDYGVALALVSGSAHAGAHGLALCDEFGRAEAGLHGVAVANTASVAEAGPLGVAIGRLGGNAVAGAEGIALACEDTGGSTGVATAGERGVALAVGSTGRVAAGEGGILILVVDGRAHVAHVGEDGILPGVAYGIGADGRWTPAAVEGGSDERPTD